MRIEIPSQIRSSHHAQRPLRHLAPTQGLQVPQAYRSPTTFGPAGVHVVAEPGLDVPEGTALNLSCRLPSGPGHIGNSTFAWFRNGRQLHTESVPTLTFTHVARAQAGLYHCQAELPAGAATSAPVLLRVLCECDILPLPQSPPIAHAQLRSSSFSVCKGQGRPRYGGLGRRILTESCLISCIPVLASLTGKH